MRPRPVADRPGPDPHAAPRARPLNRAAAAVALCCAACLAPAQQPPADAARATANPASAQPVVVPLVANATEREAVTALVDGADVWLAADDLVAAGMLPGTLPPALARSARGRSWYRLAELAQAGLLAWTFDAAQLSVQVELSPQVMATNTVDLRPAPSSAAALRRIPSAYLNYALSGTGDGPPALVLEAVGSMAGHTLLGYVSRDAQGQAARGPVTLLLNDEHGLRQTLVGDAIWSGSGLLGAVPLGGITWQSNFAFSPGLVTTPTLDLRGVATTPSTVDVLVNGALVARRQVPAGPFALGNIVAQAGANNVTAVVRDAFGRETQVGSSGFYGSPLLLQPGLTTYSVSAGLLRETRANLQPAYGAAAVMAQALRGITPDLSAGVAAQASAATQAVAAQVATTNAAGEFAGQLAHGRDAQSEGLALALSYRLSRPSWSLSLATIRRQRAFRELAFSPTGGQVLRADDVAFGRNLLGVDWSLRLATRHAAQGERLRRVGLSAARRWTPWLTTSVELARAAGTVPETSLFLLVSVLLDPLHSLYVGASQNNGRLSSTVDVVRMRQQALTTGWRLSSGWSSGAHRQLLQVNRDTRFGDYELQASHDPSGTRTNWRAAGSLLTAGGAFGLAPPISDAFAIVRVPDSPGVPVRLEGRLAGVTDRDGQAVVTGLSSYSNQRIGIDPDALPLDFEVGEVERRVSAPLRGGELVVFDAKAYRAWAGRLVDAAGEPVGSAIIEAADGRRAATGTRGDFVFEGSPPAGAARVQRPAGDTACIVRFPATLPPSTAAVQRLGDLPCLP